VDEQHRRSFAGYFVVEAAVRNVEELGGVLDH
jgi:hypothetical protein